MGNTDYTIFAPTNAAFDKVPVDTLNGLLGDKEALRKVLLRHVVPGRKIEGKDVPTGSTKLKTASGEEIKADRGKFVQVSSSNKKAFVVKFDFVGSNGFCRFARISKCLTRRTQVSNLTKCSSQHSTN